MPFIVQRRVGSDQRVREHPGKSLRFGRGTGVDVRFDDPGVDYQHAVIDDTPFGFVVRDLASTSGTWVNGQRVERAELVEGDRIVLGGFELRVRISGFGEYLYLYLEVEEIGAESASITGLHSMTMSFASRELQDLARAARARYEAEKEAAARTDSEAPTSLLRTVGRGGAAAVAGADRPPAEVSASVIFELFSESGIDLRESFAGFDRSLRESIATAADGKGPDSPRTTVRAVPSRPQGSPPKPASASRADAAPIEAPPIEATPRESVALPDLPLASGWSTSPVADSGVGEPPRAEVPAAPTSGAVPSSSVDLEGQAPHSRRSDGAPAIDYLIAYGLPGGLGVAWSLALVVLLLAMGAATATALRHTDMLSPGPLGGRHAEVENLVCGSCHTGFLGVRVSSCMACHQTVHDHQQIMPDDRGCTDCHTEHRGGDALRLVDAGICVSCHASLSETHAAEGIFADRITAFSVDHPEFAVYTEPGRRVRLDTSEARSSDPGGLKGFDHYWHMQKLPTNLRRVCGDCHRQDEAGEVVPVDFETSCRQCHQLAFDPRFPGVQAPHDTATVVTGFLVGHYVQNRQTLRDLTPRERRLGGASLSAEERLTLVAQAVAERLLRDQCNRCHVLTRKAGETEPTKVEVKPVRITERWFPHAEAFPHGQHVKLTQCADCHALAPASRATSDLILPSIGACKVCHRPAEEAEREPERLARATCRTCHSFHASTVEFRSWHEEDALE